MAKRLLYICQYFAPETFRGNDIAYYFAKQGVEVTAIVAIPNYPKGRFFDGYGLFKRRTEVINGVKVIRLPVIPRGKGGKIALLANYFSYFIAASLYMPFHLLLNRSYDACFVQQLSPVMMSFPGIIFKKLTGKKLFTWVLDLWPESLKAAGGIANDKVLAFFGWFAEQEYKHSDIILVSSPGFKKNISEKGPYIGKFHDFPQWNEDPITEGIGQTIPSLPHGFNAVFTGNIGEAQDFENIIKAAQLLTPADGINIVIIGDGRKKAWVDAYIKENNLGNRIYMLGRYDVSAMSAFYEKADCLFLSLKDNEIFNLTIPAKLQAYMASGKPIVAMLNGDSNKLICDVGCGIAVPSASPNEFVNALRKIRDMSPMERHRIGELGRQYCNTHFDKKRLLDKLYQIMFPGK